MIQIRRSKDRGHRDFGWLDARHSFSFGDYYNPAAMGFRSLRVLNEDRIAPGTGFPLHPHRNMEIITYVVSGELEHQDDLGTKAVIPAGGVQVMSAGRGIHHSEANVGSDAVHLLQIWIEPSSRGGKPWHRTWLPETNKNPILITSPDGANGSARIAQRAWLWLYPFDTATKFPLSSEEFTWVQIVSGEIETPAGRLQPGDALTAEPGDELEWVVGTPGKLLWFQLS